MTSTSELIWATMHAANNTLTNPPHLLRWMIAMTIVLVANVASANLLSSLRNSPFLPVEEAFVPDYRIDGNLLHVQFRIAPDYYLYKHRFALQSSGITASNVELTLPAGTGVFDEYFGDVEAYYDEVTLSALLPDVLNGQDLLLSYQGCAEAGLCYPPQTLVIPAFFETTSASADAGIPATVSSSPPIAQSKPSLQQRLREQPFALNLALFFLLGITLAFTPCVLPMLPILSSVIVGKENRSWRRDILLAGFYVFGVSATYALLGVLAAITGAQLNLQFWLQHPAVLGTVAALFILLGLSMLGLFTLQLPAALQSRLAELGSQQDKSQLAGLFVLGAISALIVSPCLTAPMAGALLYIASTGDVIQGASALFVLGLGSGVPLIAFVTGADKLIPRTGPWMEETKRLLAIILFAVALYLVEHLLADSLVMLLWALLAVALAWVLGAFRRPGQGMAARLSLTLGLTSLGYALVLILGLVLGNTDPLDPLSRSRDPVPTYFTRVTSPDMLQSLLQDAAKEDRYAVVDFYADWCAACIVYETSVFPVPSVREALQHAVTIKVDVTEINQTSMKLMQDYALIGLPSILFFDPDGKELREQRIEGELNAIEFENHAKWILNDGNAP